MEPKDTLTNGSNPSDEEKPAAAHVFDPHATGLPPDPDAHLSAEEKAAIVTSRFARL